MFMPESIVKLTKIIENEIFSKYLRLDPRIVYSQNIDVEKKYRLSKLGKTHSAELRLKLINNYQQYHIRYEIDEVWYEFSFSGTRPVKDISFKYFYYDGYEHLLTFEDGNGWFARKLLKEYVRPEVLNEFK